MKYPIITTPYGLMAVSKPWHDDETGDTLRTLYPIESSKPVKEGDVLIFQLGGKHKVYRRSKLLCYALWGEPIFAQASAFTTFNNQLKLTVS